MRDLAFTTMSLVPFVYVLTIVGLFYWWLCREARSPGSNELEHQQYMKRLACASFLLAGLCLSGFFGWDWWANRDVVSQSELSELAKRLESVIEPVLPEVRKIDEDEFQWTQDTRSRGHRVVARMDLNYQGVIDRDQSLGIGLVIEFDRLGFATVRSICSSAVEERLFPVVADALGSDWSVSREAW